jgi:hypothetical protein
MPPEGSLEQMGGYAPLAGDTLAVWLGDWTNEPSRSDNITKLQGAATAERHLFILFILVRSITTVPFSVKDLLFSPEAPFPTIPPCPASGRDRCLRDEHLRFERRLPVVIGDWLDPLHQSAARSS